VQEPGLACEVTLQPLARFDLDAAILFSDILTVPDAMGLGLYFADGEGPRFERPLREEWAIRDLSAPDPYDQLRYVMDAVSEIRRALDNSVPLIGFSGSPWTLACYMVEGGRASDYRSIKTMLYDRPDLLHHILGDADAVIAYLNAQIEAGAQAVMIFDSWGGSLSAAAIGVLAGLHAAHRRRPDPRERTASACRSSCSPRAAACGWSRSPDRLRRGRPRLDHRHRRSAPARRRQGGAAGQPRSERAVRLAGGDRARGREGARQPTARAIPATSSTSATAFRSSRRPTT
jgi:hypothetical protein